MSVHGTFKATEPDYIKYTLDVAANMKWFKDVRDDLIRAPIHSVATSQFLDVLESLINQAETKFNAKAEDES